MGTMIGTANDVVGFLKQQHETIRRKFENVIETRGEQRMKEFFALRRLLAVHETAEEQIVHPAARRSLAGGDALVQARLREEGREKRALAELESIDVDSPEFLAKFRALKDDVLAHAAAEESEEFEKLGTALDANQLERMRKAAEFAEAVAPTRPHPGMESATANILAGPFVAMVDRARDAIARKS